VRVLPTLWIPRYNEDKPLVILGSSRFASNNTSLPPKFSVPKKIVGAVSVFERARVVPVKPGERVLAILGSEIIESTT